MCTKRLTCPRVSVWLSVHHCFLFTGLDYGSWWSVCSERFVTVVCCLLGCSVVQCHVEYHIVIHKHVEWHLLDSCCLLLHSHVATDGDYSVIASHTLGILSFFAIANELNTEFCKTGTEC